MPSGITNTRWLLLLVLAALAACNSAPVRRAPVEDRSSPVSATPAQEVAPAKPAAAAVSPAAAAVPLPPGSENAGKPGYYTVKPGDTLARIGLEAGQSYREIARWNGLDNPNRIEAGQVIRVLPPGQSDDAVVTKPVASGKIIAAPLPAAGASAAVPTRPVTLTPVPIAAPALSDEDITFIWPAKGEIVTGFDEAKNRKGVDVGGAAGYPVLAAADGEVVYAGAGLRGYGNLIILKHNKTYLSAYAHNQSLLVKEGSSVRQGQKIAEMGNSDADQVKLHFEVRKLGKPVDPTKYLPAR
ncbi:MAG: peptidoglycan DD-metalloendopeptidase family protein [Betaproteobacteria bacterium]